MAKIPETVAINVVPTIRLHNKDIKDSLARATNFVDLKKATLPPNLVLDKEGNTALHNAVNQNDITLVEALVKAGADLTAVNKNAQTPKMLARENESSMFGNALDETPIYDYLSNAELARYKDIDYFLKLAKENKPSEMEELLKEKPYLLDMQDKNGDTALHLSIKNNQLSSTAFLLKSRASLKIKNNKGLTADKLMPNEALASLNEMVINGLVEKQLASNIIKKAIKGNLEEKKAKSTIKRIIEQMVDKDNNKAIHIAVIKNNKEALNYLIKLGTTNLNEANKYGNTALHLAVNKGDFKITKLLLEAKADMKLLNKNGESVLSIAINKGNVKIVEALLEAKVDIKLLNNALYQAINKGNLAIVEALLKAGAEVNSRNKNGNYPLHLAAQSGHEDILSALLKKGAKVNVVNQNNDTPLHSAVRVKGNLALVQRLVTAKADIYAINKEQETAKSLAYKTEKSWLVTLGITTSPMLNYLNEIQKEGDDFIKLATAGKAVELEEMLKNKPYLIIARDKNNNTALHAAASKGNAAIAEILIKNGVNIEARNNQIKSALEIAEESDRTGSGYISNKAFGTDYAVTKDVQEVIKAALKSKLLINVSADNKIVKDMGKVLRKSKIVTGGEPINSVTIPTSKVPSIIKLGM